MMNNDQHLRQWYLLTSRPHKDQQAEENLARQGYQIYRPLAQRLRKRRGKLVKVTESLFPRYLFIHLNSIDDNWAPIRSTFGVQNFVRFGIDNPPLVVPALLIDELKSQAGALGEKAIDLDRFHKGDSVMLTEGPFKGISSIFLSYDGDERALILMDILHCQTKLAVSPAKLLAA